MWSYDIGVMDMRAYLLAAPVIIAVLAGTASSRTWYVTPDGTGDAPTIRDAVHSALFGDTVLVACGTYYESDIRVNTDIVLISETGEAECVTIDGEGADRVLWILHPLNTVGLIKGFTITGAVTAINLFHASPDLVNLTLRDNCRGMMVSNGCSLHIEDVDFVANYCDAPGAAIFCDEGSSTFALEGCRFLDNAGSAVFITHSSDPSHVSIVDTEFLRNSTAVAGGLGSFVISHCTFLENNVGVSIMPVCPPESLHISDCAFERHTTWAVVFEGCAPVVENTVFLANSGNGVIYADGASPIIRNCTFAANSGRYGSVIEVLDPEPYFGPVVIENSIIAYNGLAPPVYCWPTDDSEAALSCCDVYGNDGGDWVGCIADQLGTDGNFSACPSFCDVGTGDFRLCDGSPCLPGNHPDGSACGLIGARDEGCVCGPTAQEPKTWGAIKSTYR